MAEIAARPLSLASSRGPSRPAIVTPPPAEPMFEPAPAPVAEPEAAKAQAEEATAANDLDLDLVEEAGALELTDEQAGERVAAETRSGFASLTGVRPVRADALDLGLDQVDPEDDGDSRAGTGGQDELLLDANRLSEEDGPVSPLVTRKRGFGAPAGGARAPVAGNTLFERMANLSRGVKPAAAEEGDDEDEDDGSAVSIPRFLGRQNNQ
jgi:cell division protein FtsZ